MAVHYEGTPPVAYRDEANRKGWSEWYHIHIPFSGPHMARWVKPYDADGYWEGNVCDTTGNTIPGWQSEVMWWEDIIPMSLSIREENIKLPTNQEQYLLPGTEEIVKDFNSFYVEYIRQFRQKMEKGSQNRGVEPLDATGGSATSGEKD